MSRNQNERLKTLRMKTLRKLARMNGMYSKDVAAACGVTYQHWRLVVLGERQSPGVISKTIQLLGDDARKIIQ